MNFETERLYLRQLSLKDVNDIYEYLSNPIVTRFLAFETHQSPTDSFFFVEQMIDLYHAKGIKLWGIIYTENQKLIGTISLSPWQKQPIAGIGFTLSPQYWNKGIMTEAAERVVKYAFEEMGILRIQAECISENIGSSKVLEKLGMRYEGEQKKQIKGKTWDVKMYSLLKN